MDVPGSTNGHVHADTKNTRHAPSPVELSRALSDPTRLRIVSILSTGSKSLDTITKELKLDKRKKPNVKKHLEELGKAHLVFQIEKYSDYVLLAPKLTVELIEFLNSSSHELENTFSSFSGAAEAYKDIRPAKTEKEANEKQLAFYLKIDDIFKTDVFSELSGCLRLICIKMAYMENYDFRSLKQA